MGEDGIDNENFALWSFNLLVVMGGEGLIGLSNEVIGRLGLDGERDGDGGLVLDGRLPIVLDWAKGSEDNSKISECLKRSRRSSGSACSRSGPKVRHVSDGMGRD